jgi:hypothetical protein
MPAGWNQRIGLVGQTRPGLTSGPRLLMQLMWLWKKCASALVTRGNQTRGRLVEGLARDATVPLYLGEEFYAQISQVRELLGKLAIQCGASSDTAQTKADKYPVKYLVTEDGEAVVYVWQYKHKCMRAGNGDNLMCTFQCELCHFRNIKERYPSRDDLLDKKLL